jgi:hypothetical protein
LLAPRVSIHTQNLMSSGAFSKHKPSKYDSVITGWKPDEAI